MKLEGMFTDMRTSSELTRQFAQAEGKKLSLEVVYQHVSVPCFSLIPRVFIIKPFPLILYCNCARKNTYPKMSPKNQNHTHS